MEHIEEHDTHVEPEHSESFMDLLTSTPHWLFEFTTSLVEMLVTAIIAIVVWPKIRASSDRMHARWDRAHNLHHGQDVQMLANKRPRIHITEQPVGECMDCGLASGHVVGCTSIGMAVVIDASQPAKRAPKVSDLEISSSEHLRLTTSIHTRTIEVERMTLTARMGGRDVYHRQSLGIIGVEDDLDAMIARCSY